MTNNCICYEASTWYWLVGDQSPTTQVWSVDRRTYVPLTDPTFVAWSASPFFVPYEIDTEANLATYFWSVYSAGAPLNNPVISSYEFMHRFTQPEQVTIATAAMSNATIFLFLTSLIAATQIDLSNTIVTTEVVALETAGLIANGRSTVILTP